MTSNNKYMNRFAGAVKGAVLGDCFGFPLNGMDYDQICDRFETLGALQMAVSKKSGNALFTDCTQLSMFTAEGILMASQQVENPKPEDYTLYVFYAYQYWLYTQTKGVAGKEYAWLFDKKQNPFQSKILKSKGFFKKRYTRDTNLEALARARNNKFGTIAAPVNDNTDCDGMKRCVCAGAFFAWDMELAFKMGCAFAAITHSHPDGYLPAGCYAAIVAGVMGGLEVSQAVEKVCLILQEYFGFENTLNAINNAVSLAADDSFEPLAAVRRLGLGRSACEALSIAIYCSILHCASFKKAICLAANQDGESSVCASVTGGILGAYFGEKKLPRGWLKKTQYKNLIEVITEELYDVSKIDSNMHDYEIDETENNNPDEQQAPEETQQQEETPPKKEKKSLFAGKKKKEENNNSDFDDDEDDDDYTSENKQNSRKKPFGNEKTQTEKTDNSDTAEDYNNDLNPAGLFPDNDDKE